MEGLVEWETHRGTLLAWPQRAELWSGKYKEVQLIWAKVASLLSKTEEVHILINPVLPNQNKNKYINICIEEKIRNKIEKYNCKQTNLIFHEIPTDDVWIRDYGPVWISPREGLTFLFDGWGKKHFPHTNDNLASKRLLEKFGHHINSKKIILEGGAIESNGDLLLVNDACIFHRETRLTYSKYEEELKNIFQTKNILWLKGCLPGDDTDGHVDMVSRFVEEKKILHTICDSDHPAFTVLKEIQKKLENFFTKEYNFDKQIEIIYLPLPKQVFKGNFPIARNYANFYIANKQIITPVYKDKKDEEALNIIQACFPNHSVEAIDSNYLLLEGGAIHCMTKHIPVFVAI